MKIEKIDSRIAALYLGQKCTITWLVEDGIFELGEQEPARIRDTILKWMDSGKCSIIPHLRRLESLTEDEARELQVFWDADGFNQTNGFIDSKILFAIGSPVVWLKLLEWGIDLFGLIDAGLAKEVEPKKD